MQPDRNTGQFNGASLRPVMAYSAATATKNSAVFLFLPALLGTTGLNGSPPAPGSLAWCSVCAESGSFSGGIET